MRPRLALVVLVTVVIALSLPSGLASAATHTPRHANPVAPNSVRGLVGTSSPHPEVGAGSNDPTLWSPRPELNLTLAPHAGAPFASPAVSAVPVEAPPSLPSTTPTVVSLAVGLKNCCLNQTFTLPYGNWSRIVLTYVGSIFPVVYDSSYRAFVDKVPVLFGTTPEYGTWTVVKDLTEYSALLRGPTNIEFVLGAAVVGGGYFLANLSLSFYPVPPGGAPPQEPNEIVPLWNAGPGQTPGAPSESQGISLPSDVVNATMELYTYGFNPAGDEFWYDSSPSFRTVTVASNSTPIATLYPFPFINTGGIDLFLWRPVTGVATVNNPPQHFDLSAWLPFLEGPHTLTATFTGIGPGSNWLCRGSLLLYTDPNVTGASLLGASHQLVVGSPTTSGTTVSQTATASYSASTVVSSAAGNYYLNGSVHQLFSSNITTTMGGPTTWTNVSMDTRTIGSTVATGPSATTFVNHTFDAPFHLDFGNEQKIIQKTNGSYPIYVAFNTSLLNGIQTWNESTTTSTPGGPSLSGWSVLDLLAGADGVYGGVLYLQSASSAPLVYSVSLVSTSAPREYSLEGFRNGLHASYVHVVVASALNPPGPNYVADVVTNTLSAPIAAAGTVSRAVVEVGEPTVFSITTMGGSGALTIRWSGLPSGCPSADSASLSCTPQQAGTFEVGASLTDAVGDQATFDVASLLVLPAPNVSIVAAAPAIDLGGSITLNASVLGGSAPFDCTWVVNGVTSGPARSCSQPFSLTASGGTQVTVNVTVVDSLGSSGRSVDRVFPVAAPLSAVLQNGSSVAPSTLRAVSGSVLRLGIILEGGTSPYTVNWFLDGVPFAVGAWANVSIGRIGATQTVYATIADAGGGSNQTSAVSITSVAGATPVNPPSSGSGGSGLWEDLALAGFGLAIAFAAGLAVAVLRARPPPARR